MSIQTSTPTTVPATAATTTSNTTDPKANTNADKAIAAGTTIVEAFITGGKTKNQDNKDIDNNQDTIQTYNGDGTSNAAVTITLDDGASSTSSVGSLDTSNSSSSKPAPPSADPKLLDEGLVKMLPPEGGDPKKSSGSGWFGAVQAVALEESTALQEKLQEVGQKLSASLQIGFKNDMMSEVASEQQNIEASAKVEAVKDIVVAACSLASGISDAGFGLGGMHASTTQKQQMYQLGGQACQSAFQFLQNAASAPLDIEKGDLDAAKIAMDAIVQIFQQQMQTEGQTYDQYQSNFDQLNQNLNQNLQVLSSLIKGITPQG